MMNEAELRERSGSTCELCGATDGLVKYDGEDWLLYMLQQGEELKYLLDLEAYSSLQEWLDSGYEMPKNQVLIDGVHKYFTKQ